MSSLLKYFKLWAKLTAYSFMVSLTSRFNAIVFFIGKLFRFLFFAIFLLALFSQTKTIAGYNAREIVFFFLTFNFIDTVTQLFFREVYRFRPLVVSGNFDLVLVKPISPLFRALAGGADPLDLFMLVPYIGAIIYVGLFLTKFSLPAILLYLLLLVNSFLIATGFHVLVLSLAVVTTEIDHTIMIYRDLTSMGRVPVDIYREPLRLILTFIIPVGIMMTIPAKAFFGLIAPGFAVVTFTVGLTFLYFSVKLWRFALSRYSSASS